MPNGSTTERIIPSLVAPSASAPSRSPTGACENTSRITEVAIGVTIRPTTTPAMNSEDVYGVGPVSGSLGSTPGTSRNGTQPNQVDTQRAMPVAWFWKKNSPHRPYTTLGTAAIRSTRLSRVDLRRRGAYSER